MASLQAEILTLLLEAEVLTIQLLHIYLYNTQSCATQLCVFQVTSVAEHFWYSCFLGLLCQLWMVHGHISLICQRMFRNHW